MKTLKKIYYDILNFFFPLRCQDCDRYLDSYPVSCLCGVCRDKLFGELQLVCAVCGKPAPRSAEAPYYCGDCRYKSKPDLIFLSAGDYEGLLKKLIHKMKYKKKRFIGEILGEYLLKFTILQDINFGEFDYIIPVPLSSVKMRERGFNQVECLSGKLSNYYDLPIRSKVISRKHHKYSQASLNRSDRLNNLKDVFAVSKKHDLAGKTVILVDDVISTGTTIYFCSERLFEAGVRKVIALTVAFND